MSARPSPLKSPTSQTSCPLQKKFCQIAGAAKPAPVERATSTCGWVPRLKVMMSALRSPFTSATLQMSCPVQRKSAHFCCGPKLVPLESATRMSPCAIPVCVSLTKLMASVRPSPLTSPVAHS